MSRSADPFLQRREEGMCIVPFSTPTDSWSHAGRTCDGGVGLGHAYRRQVATSTCGIRGNRGRNPRCDHQLQVDLQQKGKMQIKMQMPKPFCPPGKRRAVGNALERFNFCNNKRNVHLKSSTHQANREGRGSPEQQGGEPGRCRRRFASPLRCERAAGGRDSPARVPSRGGERRHEDAGRLRRAVTRADAVAMERRRESPFLFS